MQTNIVNAAQANTQSAATTRSTTANMGKDEFLKILVAQLQNQDPTEPMKDTDFIAQMAQFSSLEQMQQLNAGFGYTQAYSLLGKTVTSTITGSDGNQSVVSGVVSGVTTVSSQPYLVVNGNLVPMSSKFVVSGEGQGSSILQGAMLIGKFITGSYTDEAGAQITIAGAVEKVAMQHGEPIVFVNGRGIRLQDITEVANSASVSAG